MKKNSFFTLTLTTLCLPFLTHKAHAGFSFGSSSNSAPHIRISEEDRLKSEALIREIIEEQYKAVEAKNTIKPKLEVSVKVKAGSSKKQKKTLTAHTTLHTIKTVKRSHKKSLHKTKKQCLSFKLSKKKRAHCLKALKAAKAKR